MTDTDTDATPVATARVLPDAGTYVSQERPRRPLTYRSS